jgi:molybdopterin-guanine dinucleotide biosynthesis protein A
MPGHRTIIASGAVLAGGRASRFGANKALAEFRGRPLIAYALDALRPLTSDLFIVAPPEAAYAPLGVPVRSDRHAGAGPLGGIHAALHEAICPVVVCLACDLPFVRTATIAYLLDRIEGYDAVVPVASAGLEPLHAVYAKSCLPAIEAMLGRGLLKVDALFSAVRTRQVTAEELLPMDPTGRAFWNVNTPEELERASAWLPEAERERGRPASEQGSEDLSG